MNTPGVTLMAAASPMPMPAKREPGRRVKSHSTRASRYRLIWPYCSVINTGSHHNPAAATTNPTVNARSRSTPHNRPVATHTHASVGDGEQQVDDLHRRERQHRRDHEDDAGERGIGGEPVDAGQVAVQVGAVAHRIAFELVDAQITERRRVDHQLVQRRHCGRDDEGDEREPGPDDEASGSARTC